MIRPSGAARHCRIMARVGLAALLLVAGSATLSAAAGKGRSGLPLPRFVSISGAKVNLRTGPGVRYPVAWVFVRANLPVLVTLEFENWRKVRDLDGAEGWVHQSLLSGRRHGVVTGQVRFLRRAPRPDSPALLRAEPGVIGRLLTCREGWCRMEIDDVTGWLPQAHLFGALAGESFD